MITIAITTLKASVAADSTSSKLATPAGTEPFATVGMMMTELVPPTMAPTSNHVMGDTALTCPNSVASQKKTQLATMEHANPSRPSRMPRGATAATSASRSLNAPPDRMTVNAIAPKYGIADVRSLGWTNSNTGPASIPATTSQTTSGTPVRAKMNSPSAPSSSMPATTTIIVATGPIVISLVRRNDEPAFFGDTPELPNS